MFCSLKPWSSILSTPDPPGPPIKNENAAQKQGSKMKHTRIDQDCSAIPLVGDWYSCRQPDDCQSNSIGICRTIPVHRHLQPRTLVVPEAFCVNNMLGRSDLATQVSWGNSADRRKH